MKLRWAADNAEKKQKFWKISALVYLLQEVTINGTFHNLCLVLDGVLTSKKNTRELKYLYRKILFIFIYIANYYLQNLQTSHGRGTKTSGASWHRRRARDNMSMHARYTHTHAHTHTAYTHTQTHTLLTHTRLVCV